MNGLLNEGANDYIEVIITHIRPAAGPAGRVRRYLLVSCGAVCHGDSAAGCRDKMGMKSVTLEDGSAAAVTTPDRGFGLRYNPSLCHLSPSNHRPPLPGLTQFIRRG